MDKESFRDSIATADPKGRRLWVYPGKPKGRLYTARSIVAYALLAFFFITPFLKFNGHPIILLDVLERNFIIFGLIFKPQDFYILVLVALTLLVFIVLFTAVFGRLFCGWVCPQTIFLEMVFRRIDYWIDGRPGQQKKLDKAPWGFKKIFKRFLKHSIFMGVSIIICHFSLAYIIGIDGTLALVTQPPWNHSTGFIAMITFCFLFYGVFSWFREQACTLVCPYGRLQSVLIDSNSIIVAYDYNRGEPRGKYIKGKENNSLGDCIECQACVRVCPTGIDIRNGTQLECVNCSACIDACNSVMRKTKRPEGLIRYTSENSLSEVTKPKSTGRIIVYSVVLILLLSLSLSLLTARTNIEAIILRAPGSLYFEGDNNAIQNLYTVKLSNKTFEEIPLSFRLKEPTDGTLSMVSGMIVLEPEEITESAFLVDFPRKQLFGSSVMITIEVISRDEVIDEITTSFMGPDRMKEKSD
ncbi:MAG: cytochrome c oxidase accessory protein CcoG [candidate division Zixibacteria bacterium]|nr:cytochrome c oxidase accessory protein CcoG [candidate division Zixibacteria bacterium]